VNGYLRETTNKGIQGQGNEGIKSKAERERCVQDLMEWRSDRKSQVTKGEKSSISEKLGGDRREQGGLAKQEGSAI